MDRSMIREIVEEVVDELENKRWLRAGDEILYIRGAEMAKNFFKGGDETHKERIESLQIEPYYDVLELYFGKGKTLEKIAEMFGVSTQTINLNKKKLCIRLAREVRDERKAK